MKISFNKTDFDRAISPALGCVSGKNTMASLEGILLSAKSGDSECGLCAYDLEKGFRTAFDAKVSEGGSFIINAQKLSAIIRALPDGLINLEIDEKNLVNIYSGKSVFELVALDGSAFPAMPQLSGDRKFTIRRGDLRAMVNQTIFAIAVNDSRPSLNGAYFKIEGSRILAVSCDGNRLALRERTCELSDVVAGNDVADDGTVTVNESGVLNADFIIPGKTLSELLKLIGGDDDEPMKIQLARKHVIFEVSSEKEDENGNVSGKTAVFFSRLIDSEYIEYERFIPKANKTFVKVDREKFLSGLEMAALFSEDRSMGQARTGVSCVFEDDTLRISSAASSGRFVDEIQTEMDGDPIELGFNCRFLIDALRSCDTEKVKLSMSSPIMSIIIEAPEEEETPDSRFLMLVVPMKPIKR